jgi:hypothetical protein
MHDWRHCHIIFCKVQSFIDMKAMPGVRVTMLTVYKKKQYFLNKFYNGYCIFDRLKVTLWYLAFYIFLWVFLKGVLSSVGFNYCMS